MQEFVQPTEAILPSQRRPLGFLIEPMDWAARALIERANSPVTVSGRLLEIGRARMHVIAIALAHDTTESLSAEQLLHGRLSEILDQVLTPKPAGMRGVINRLPPRVLQPESYRNLVSLMRDPRLGEVLAHGEGLDDRSVAALAGVPGPLRRVVLAALEDEIGSAAGLAVGLRWFADRGAAASYEGLVADLALRRQPGQLIARLRRLVEALPWPERGPPVRVGPADRIDKPDAIRRLAKAWQNCLADYLEHIEEGRCAAYQWLAPPGPIVALVQRHGRLGWFLEQTGAPNNGDVADGMRETVEAAFLGAGIPPAGVVEPIEALLSSVDPERHFRG